jgi:hypothetical protein
MTTSEKNCKDMADVCELAHKRTVRQCKKVGINVNCYGSYDCGDRGQDHDKNAEGTHYGYKAQIFFNDYYDHICEVTGL